jgi:twitching motility protein PilJ
MNWLNNLKVQSKLLLVLFVMITGYTVIGTVYSSVLKHNNEAEVTLKTSGDAAYLTLKTSELVQQARRAEKNFELGGDLTFDKRHDDIMKELSGTIDHLKILLGAWQGEGLHDAESERSEGVLHVDEVLLLLTKYQTEFKSMVSTRIELGLDHDSGLQGKLQASADEIGALLKKAGQTKLTASMLTMRGYEKDYILRQGDEYSVKMAKQQQVFARLLAASKVSKASQKIITAKMNAYNLGFLELVKATKLVARKIEASREAVLKVAPAIALMKKQVEGKKLADVTRIDEESQILTLKLVAAIAASAGAMLLLMMLIIASLTHSLLRLQGTISDLAKGNYDARVDLESKDELGQLGRAFDSMLDERLVNLANAELENQNLNDSIIELLEAVSDLSERDLTVKVPVNADVTGPVADAMNLMTGETANVLTDIRAVAEQVADASNRVQAQGTKVTDLANNERVIVEDTMGKLEESSKSMKMVASLAKACNDTAVKASASTQVALETVTKTANGMSGIRETIAETEKRIKRLGERSQEINGVVEIINNIAERTHVLALNASMQAAAAGDAGRGFAVVADEVQRLAESSRQSTSEIAGLVGNIQAETAETMATMNKTIAQVVEGTELAQAAGGQMEATQKMTAELANAVEQIASQSRAQSQVSNGLRDQAAQVQVSTQETSAELVQQSNQTENLVEFSKLLVNSVNVFKLPEAS